MVENNPWVLADRGEKEDDGKKDLLQTNCRVWLPKGFEKNSKIEKIFQLQQMTVLNVKINCPLTQVTI